MSFWQKILPSYTPRHIAEVGGVAILRDRVLQVLLLGLLAVGAAGEASMIVSEIRQNHYTLIPVYLAIYGLLVVITLFREIPFQFKAACVSILSYSLAIVEIFDTALLGEIRFWLLVSCVITALLLGYRAMLVATAASVGTVILLGIGIQNAWFAPPNAANFTIGTDWITGSLMLALASLGIGLGASTLLNGLQRMVTEREALVSQLENERQTLEQRVNERTADLQRRLSQSRAAADISNSISQFHDPATLYQQVVDVIREHMGLYYVGLFLVDNVKQFAVLAAGTGEAGLTMRERGHRLQIGSNSMIGWSIANRQARIALDVGDEAVRFNNPLLPLTRSELAIPIISRGEALGALTIQSDIASAFDQNDMTTLQGIADSLATALENTRLLAELQQNLDELRSLNRDYITRAWTDVIDERRSGVFAFEDKNIVPGSEIPVDVPIMLREQMIAHLTLDMDETQLSADDLAFLDAITTQTALALENARLVQETERRVVQEQKLNQMSARFSRAVDVESILKAAVEELGQLPSVTEVTVELLDSSEIQTDLDSLAAAPEA